MMNRLHTLIRDERGNSLVEMGIMLPVFSALLIGATDIARAYSMKMDLEQAAQRSIEWVQVRDFKESDVADIKTNAASGAGVSTSAVTVDYWLECDAARTSWSSACAENQTLARYISVEVKKDYDPLFDTRYFSQASGGVVPIKAKAGIRIQ
jgi:Flp pilus assembly protein TadG